MVLSISETGKTIPCTVQKWVSVCNVASQWICDSPTSKIMNVIYLAYSTYSGLCKAIAGRNIFLGLNGTLFTFAELQGSMDLKETFSYFDIYFFQKQDTNCNVGIKLEQQKSLVVLQINPCIHNACEVVKLFLAEKKKRQQKIFCFDCAACVYKIKRLDL